jgi:uncharacterized protein with HEPN domain
MRFEANKYLFDIQRILIHGYADVDDQLVWDIVETKLPVLSKEIAELIE